jgi:hypothetical protein
MSGRSTMASKAPGQTEQCVWDVIVMAEMAAMEARRRFMAVTRRRGDQGEAGLDAGLELAERGARRAVMDFWGRLYGFTQLGVPRRGWASACRSPPPNSKNNRNGTEMLGAVISMSCSGVCLFSSLSVIVISSCNVQLTVSFMWRRSFVNLHTAGCLFSGHLCGGVKTGVRFGCNMRLVEARLQRCCTYREVDRMFLRAPVRVRPQ